MIILIIHFVKNIFNNNKYKKKSKKKKKKNEKIRNFFLASC